MEDLVSLRSDKDTVWESVFKDKGSQHRCGGDQDAGMFAILCPPLLPPAPLPAP